MDIKSDIGLKIRALRKQKNINQSALAEMIERSPEAVSNLERGVSLPSMETLIRLSQQLNTPLTYFFDNTTLLSREVIVVQEYERDKFEI